MNSRLSPATIGEEMENTVILETEGYEVAFEVRGIRIPQSTLDVTVGFSLASNLGRVELKALPVPIFMRDLQRMTMYLEQHIANLQKDPWGDSDTFVTLDCQFKMRALAGEVRSLNDGEFGLQFLVNVGRPNDESSYVYCGSEAVVTLKNINRFIILMRHMLREMKEMK